MTAPQSDLQKIVQEVSSSKNMPEKIVALSKAFEIFSQETSKLEKAYLLMKDQFEEVNKQLEETNQKLKEKILELDITTDYLDNILNNMSQGLLFVSSNGLVTTYNPSAEFLLGIERSEVLFRSFEETFGDLFFGFSMKEALESTDVPKLTLVNLPITSKRTSERQIEVEATFVLKNNQGRKTSLLNTSSSLDVSMGIIVLMRDVTEIRNLQLIADRNDRMKELGEMAAMVAHEIRNPLGGIKGFASLLERDLVEHPKMQQMAHYIVEGTDSLNKLVTNVLNFSRPLELEWHSISLGGLIQDLIQFVRLDKLVKDNIRIILDTPKHEVIAKVDASILKSALLNLIVNAIQAMPNGGDLILGLKDEESCFIISIEDTGEGIPEANIQKIFRPFFTTKATGHGFGLAEVFRVVQAHHGSIEVDSHIGKGTTFTIKIPKMFSHLET